MSWLAQASKEKKNWMHLEHQSAQAPAFSSSCSGSVTPKSSILATTCWTLELTGTISLWPNLQMTQGDSQTARFGQLCQVVPPAHLWWGSQTPLCPGLGFLVVQVVLVLCLMPCRVSGRTSDQTSSAVKAPSASALTKQIWVAQSASGKTSYHMFKLLFFILSQILSQNEPKLSNFALDCGACNGIP